MKLCTFPLFRLFMESNDVFFIVFGLFLLGYIIILFSSFLFMVVDEIWIAVFGRPLYTHLYLFPKTVSAQEEEILNKRIVFYNKLEEKNKKYFRHRMASFKNNCEFVCKEDFQLNTEAQVIISATYVMLTFGMRKYLFDVFDKIIIYPDVYYSTINEQYHQGEFNPRMKAVVFSWKHFYEGFSIDNNNLILGLHEFTHAIHYKSMKNQDASSLSFKKHFNNLIKVISQPEYKQRLINSTYFRIYAYTNHFEFISVIIEHYFETPDQFKKEFPELFANVSLMLNHKPSK